MFDLAWHRGRPAVLMLILLLGGLLALQPAAPVAARVPPAAEPTSWQTAADLSPARFNLGAAANRDAAYYVVGGVGDDGAFLGRLERYDPAGDAWTTLESLPQPLSQPAVVAIGRRIQVIGGLTAARTPTDQNIAYETGQATWLNLVPYPAARNGIMAAAWRGQVYAAGGLDASGAASREAWRYDMARDAWFALQNMPQAAGRGAAAAANGYIFFVGGVAGGQPVAAFARYDPTFNVWFQGPSLPGGRVAPVVAMADDWLYVLNGGGLLGDPDLPWPSALRYRLSQFPNGQWEMVDTRGLFPLVGSAGVCADGKLWVVGGKDLDGLPSTLNHYLELESPCRAGSRLHYLPLVRVLQGRATPAAGVWSGRTDHGDPFGFTLDLQSSALPAGSLTGSFHLQTCQREGPVTIEFTVGEAVPVDMETLSFAYDSGLRHISGQFTSETTAQGIYSLQGVLVPQHGSCQGSGTWQAAWQAS